jgi:hypothetical protein
MSLEDEILIDFDDFISFTHKKELKGKKSRKTEKSSKTTRGGYKLVSVDLETLKNESKYMEIEIEKLITQWKDKKLSNKDVVSLYILIYLNKRHPTKFLEGINEIVGNEEMKECYIDSKNFDNFINITSNNIKQRLLDSKTFTVFDLINKFNLHGIPKASRIALVKWYLNIYDIVPMLEVATAEQVIELQANKKRCVTLQAKDLDKLIENHRDALSFVIHDLQHAFKMFDNQVLLKGQVAFSILMLKIVKCDLIRNLLSSDQEFSESFNYLVSDMNSHTKHLFFHFKACLINAFKRIYKLNENEHLNGESLEDFNKNFENILDLFEMNEIEKESARCVLHTNQNDQFNSFDFNILNNFFLNLYDLKYE